MDELYIKHSRNYAFGKDLNKELKELEQEERFEECMVVADIIRSMKIAEKLNEKK